MSAAPTEVFAALGDPTRQRLLDAMARSDQSASALLAERVGITRQAVEKHLRVLEGAALVRSDRDGRRVVYAIRPETLHRAASWLEARGDEWTRQLAAVKRLAEGGRGS